VSEVLPADQADEWEWLAFAHAGVLTSAQATRLLTPGTARGLVRSGRWRSVCRGILVTGNGRLTRDQQLWVAVLAAGPRAVLAGVTAAGEAGVRGLRAEPLHVLVPAGDRWRRCCVGFRSTCPPWWCIARRCSTRYPGRRDVN
jgi:hypothetical protein